MLNERQQANKDLMEEVFGKEVTDEYYLSVMVTTPKGSLKF